MGPEPAMRCSADYTSFERFCCHNLGARYGLRHQTFRNEDNPEIDHTVMLWKPHIKVSPAALRTAGPSQAFSMITIAANALMQPNQNQRGMSPALKTKN
jgi:hypothetical protein